jgi:hypothetical protein
MIRFASAALLGASFLLVSSPALACDEHGSAEPKIISAHRQGRPANVLERVDKLLETASKCDATTGKCSHAERRVYEKLTGSHVSPQLPKDARYDASAGVFL